MQEKHIVEELEGSIEQLLPVPSLKVAVEHGRAVQWDLRVKANYQGLRFDLGIEVVPANNLPVFRNKINRLKSSVQGGHVVPVLAAPYLSPERQALCREPSTLTAGKKQAPKIGGLCASGALVSRQCG